MQRDLDSLGPDAVLDCDVCVVGSGAAGMALATELLSSRLKVIVLESGRFDANADIQKLYDVDFGQRPLTGAHTGRHRILGGSTTAWGGQSLRLNPIDFQHRDWVQHSGWPIDFAGLESFYQRASAFLLTDSDNFDTDLFRRLKMHPPAFDEAAAHFHFSKWSRQPDLRKVYAAKIEQSPNITLLTSANLCSIELNEAATHVKTLSIRSLAGKRASVTSRAVVLAAGGIETARLLLASRGQQRNGVGNDRGLVGRFLQDHPATLVGRIDTGGRSTLQRAFNLFYAAGTKFSPRLSMSPAAQRRLRTLSVSAIFSFFPRAGSSLEQVKAAVSGMRRGRLSAGAFTTIARGMLFSGPALVGPAFEYAVRGRAFVADAVAELRMITEQEPNPDSRVTLSADRTDALGLPRAVVDWRLTDLTFHTIETYRDLIAGELNRLELGTLIPTTDWRDQICDSYHHIGTTRMAASPEHGVVDTDCRVHGIDNLFIAGSSVFPTGGHSNPTLTLLALAIRLADHLKTLTAA